MNQDTLEARRFIHNKIYDMFKHLKTSETQPNKLPAVVRRLECGLYRNAASMEEYLNLDTLETRVLAYVKHNTSNISNSPSDHVVKSSSSSIVPTPGMPWVGNRDLETLSYMDSTVVAATNGNSLADAGTLDLSNAYQQSTSQFFASFNGNIFLKGVQTTPTQMIPTPGFSSMNNHNRVESQPPHQNQNDSGQSMVMTQNTSGCTVSGQRSSSLQKKSCGYSSVPVTPVSDMSRSHLQMCTDVATSGGYISDSAFSDSSKLPHQHHNKRQRLSTTGNGYGIIPSSSSGCDVRYLDGSNQSTSNAPSISRTDNLKTSMSNLPNIHQVATSQHEIENQLQSHNHQEDQLLPQQHKAQIFQHKQKQHNQQLHAMIRTDSLGRPQTNPDIEIKIDPDHEIECQDDQSKGSQFIPVSPVSQEICPSLDQATQQRLDLLHPEPSINASNVSSSMRNQVQSVWTLQSHLNFKSEEMSKLPGDSKPEQTIKEFEIQGRDEAQTNCLPSQTNQENAYIRIEASHSDATACQPNCQWRWLLFLRHARRCTTTDGKCLNGNCMIVQKLWRHMAACRSSQCTVPQCDKSKKLLTHHKNCKNLACPVCIPVKKYVDQQLKAHAHSAPKWSIGDSPKTCYSENQPVAGISDDGQPVLKQIKFEPDIFHNSESSTALLPSGGECIETLVKGPEFKVIPSLQSQSSSFVTKDTVDDGYAENKPSCEPMLKADHVSETIEVEKEMDQPKQENSTLPGETSSMTKPGKLKIKGISLVELFTTDQVKQHIQGLRQWVGQSKAKVEKNQALEHVMNENSCQLCAVEKLTLKPTPIYCTRCSACIKRNAMYYTIAASVAHYYFCMSCYNESRQEIVVDKISIPKSKMEKKKNDEVTEEGWVKCDKCEMWQHQICALFNCRRNNGGQADYTCPNCYMEEVNRGERMPLPQSAVLGAKDLPRTILSDHIEQRLFRRLRQEKQERAKKLQGISCNEVPSAEGLVVRVVSSVDKKLEVKPHFLKIFQEENYPKEFPYKSKVILLFQNIEGVEVCLFGMYVQEYGSECQWPNHRRVYLSYLDSVKYFRPEIKTVTGEALRTYVYHEILSGYLEYCKGRGFTSCYIWACPPLKGDDYILYCHPEIQKTPKSDKLRQWYLAMLRKALEEGIVVGLTNMYDHFFIRTGECKAKITAARLPYFDGDYWPGAAEDIIPQLHQEDGKKLLKSVPSKRNFTKWSLRASGQCDLSSNTSKDLLLMKKIREKISPMKEDFIMVHLQHACTHCCSFMVSGKRWVCTQCKNFQICDRCYETEQKLEDKDKHPINLSETHILHPVEITDVPDDTKDKDENLENEFFDTRQAFLSLCQGNHYQYDTLRRAKHSSMMVLYHLHNPIAPAYISTCSICHLDIDAGQGWRCEVCPDYDVCNSCYLKDGVISHPHKFTNQSPLTYSDAQNKEGSELRVLQFSKMLSLLVHASQCRFTQCQYPHCRNLKKLFRHAMSCKLCTSGGCVPCKKMWYLLLLHSRNCKESECNVPRCRDLREYCSRSQNQSEFRRRAAVEAMMRQREAGNSGS